MTYQRIDASNYGIYNEDEKDLVVGMADTNTNPNAMVILIIKKSTFSTLSRTFETCMNDNIDCTYHSQNASLANATVMCTSRFKMRTLLAISQFPSLQNILNKGQNLEIDDRNILNLTVTKSITT